MRYHGGVLLDRGRDPSAGNPRWRLVLAVALVQLAAGWVAAGFDACTSDETAHLTAGFVQHRTGQAHLDPEAGPLVKLLSSVPLLFLDLALPTLDSPDFLRGDVWAYGSRFMHRMRGTPQDGPPTDNDTETILRWGRLPNLLLAVLLSLLVYRVALEWLGGGPALVAFLLAVTCPNLQAHGRYATADVPVTLGFLAVVWAWARLLREVTPANVALAGASSAFLATCKFSAPLVLPALVVASGFRLLDRSPWPARAGRAAAVAGERSGLGRRAVLLAGCWTLIAVTALLAIWAGCGFRYAASTTSDRFPGRERPSFLMPYGRPSASVEEAWSDVLAANDASARLVSAARRARVLPESYLYGAIFTTRMAEKRGAFLNGRFSNTGFRSYFPLAFLYKTPPGTIVLVLIGAAVLIRSPSLVKTMGLGIALVFAATYAAASVGSHLNIGHRHLLPIYPVLFLVAAAFAGAAPRRALFRVVALAALVSAVASGVLAWPDTLSYFNLPSGGKMGGYRRLVDSNLDWGHDLERLGRFLEKRRPGARVTLDYEGSGNPRTYGIEAEALPAVFEEGRRPGPGVFAVSATRLAGIFAPTLPMLPRVARWTAEHEAAWRAALATSATLDSIREGRLDARGLLARDPEWAEVVSAGGEVDAAYAARVERARRALDYLRFLAALRERPPDARVGASYFIHDLDEAAIESALSPASAPPERGAP